MTPAWNRGSICDARVSLLEAADALRLFALAVGAEQEAQRWGRMRAAVELASTPALAAASDALMRAVVEGVRDATCLGTA